MITIIDVAKHANVSKSTVSRVVSGKGYVSKESREKVNQSIGELGYIPNNLAKQFQSGRTRTIGFIAPSFFSMTGKFLQVFMETAKEFGYFVNLYLTEGDKQKEIEALNQLKFKQLDAVFIMTRVNDWEIIRQFHHFGPLSTWNRINEDWIYSSYFDHYEAYLNCLNYLYDNGYRKIGHVLGSGENLNTKARKKAIKKFHKDKNLPFMEEWVLENSGIRNSGRSIAKKWLSSKNRPDALAFYTDYVAAQFISRIENDGYSSPNDIGVIGFDNSDSSSLMHLTTVDYSIENQAYNSFIFLYNQLNNDSIDEKKLTSRIVERKTIINKRQS